MRRTLRRSTLVLLATGALASSGAALAQEQDQPQEQPQPPGQVAGATAPALPAGQIPAVLKARETEFIYRSSSRLMSCEQLRNHVAVILNAVGARQDVQVRANDCETFIDPASQMGSPNTVQDRNPLDTRSARSESVLDRMRPSPTTRTQSTPVRIQVMMPVPVTAKILDEVDKDKARRELVSRVTGNQNIAFDDAIFFPAERREVTLSYDTIKIDSMDCELLEQMAQTVFRELDLKVTGQPLSCDRRQRSHMKPTLRVEALLPVGVPMPGEKPK